ncbi:MAG: hypothetical protein R3C10_18090 [Pirellulales bacterium]
MATSRPHVTSIATPTAATTFFVSGFAGDDSLVVILTTSLHHSSQARRPHADLFASQLA